MNRLSTLIFWLLFLSFNSFGTDFEKLSLEEALIKGKQENKPVFVYFTSKACGPCVVMQREVFPNDTIAGILKNDFVAIKYDGDSWRGEPLVKKFQIMAYPSMLIFNTEGFIVRRNIGYLEVSELKEFLAIGNATKGRAGDNMLTEREMQILEYKNRAGSNDFPVELVVRLGLHRAELSGVENRSRVGWSAGLLLAIEKGRGLLRTGIEFEARGNQINKLPYLTVPVDLGLSVYKGGLFGLPGGVRCIVTPYYSLLLNNRDNQFRHSDYGFRNGIAAFVGQTSKLELLLSYNHGVPNVSKVQDITHHSRTFSLLAAFTF